MDKPICYLICGFLGAGKTTYSKQLSQKTGAIHLNPDDYCMKLFSKEEYEKNWDRCFGETIEHLWEKATEYARQGKSIIFDMGFWTKQSRYEAIERAIHSGFNPIIHYVYALDSTLKERISKRQGTIADYNFNHFDELKKKFEEPEEKEQYVRIENY